MAKYDKNELKGQKIYNFNFVTSNALNVMLVALFGDTLNYHSENITL